MSKATERKFPTAPQDGRTALHRAVLQRDARTLRKLLKPVMDGRDRSVLMIRDVSDRTMFDYAPKAGPVTEILHDVLAQLREEVEEMARNLGRHGPAAEAEPEPAIETAEGTP